MKKVTQIFSSELCVEESLRKNANFFERNYSKKLANCFCIRFRALRISWDRKSNVATSEGGGEGEVLCVVNWEQSRVSKVSDYKRT